MSQLIEKPETYVVCTATEGSCPLSETCLRSKVHRETDYTSASDNRQLTVVNLWNSAFKPMTAECEMYRKAETKRFARGFSHLFDNVPKGIYGEVQMQVQQAFTSRRVYFYCKNGTQLTSPEEQQRIEKIFKQYGIAEAPQYDGYVDVYDWA